MIKYYTWKTYTGTSCNFVSVSLPLPCTHVMTCFNNCPAASVFINVAAVCWMLLLYWQLWVNYPGICTQWHFIQLHTLYVGKWQSKKKKRAERQTFFVVYSLMFCVKSMKKMLCLREKIFAWQNSAVVFLKTEEWVWFTFILSLLL